MKYILTYIKMVSGGICAAATFIWGGMDTVFMALLVMMTADYFTGVLGAIKQKTLSSSIGFDGLLKKIGILSVAAIAHLIGNITNIPDLRSFVIGFYIANEGISIIENCGILGVPLPEKLVDVLKQLKDDK